ncbi:hypothetical protein [Pseudomonas sp. NPDC086278]|uniref:hypothetical protein n=1 Tax=Pseudomonas sp. NPDC086278 TaxID=3390646 RepID=UPI003D02F3B9
MNLHFQPLKRNEQDRIPTHAYGRFDHAELSDDGSTALVAFDLVDADWLTMVGYENEMFSLEGLPGQANIWRQFTQRQQHEHPQKPFDNMPVYRLEIELSASGDWFGLPALGGVANPDMETLEKTWIDFHFIPPGNGDGEHSGTKGSVYTRMFEESLTLMVHGTLAPAPMARSLSIIFSLDRLPRINQADFENLLGNEVLAEWLVVFDVGQGNACALLEACDQNQNATAPRLYFDLGAGVYRNKQTQPPNLQFSFYSNPLVVLSHWDSDHWAGANLVDVDGNYPALGLTWIAPSQKVGPTHIAFVNGVIAAHGKVLIYDPPAPSTVGAVTLGDKRRIRFMCGTGSGRNNSGLVMTVENTEKEVARSWILTGDCDYEYFVKDLTPELPVALIAPHHGANLSTTDAPRFDLYNAYRRLVYSFGQNNKHGKTKVRHPTYNGVMAHHRGNWKEDGWNVNDPGLVLATDDVRSTCEHTNSNNRGGILIGWDEPQQQIDLIRTFKTFITPTTQS